MSRPKILIVDDEVFFRRLFSEILSEGDLYDIDTVDSGKDALDYLTRNQVDIILSDMVMPEICGLELLRRTRSIDPAPDIILATGNATVETAIQALKGGARDYLLKPCNPEQLRHTVKSCLEQRRLIAENSLLQSQIRLYRKGQYLSGQLDIDTLFQESLSALLQELSDGRGLAYLSSLHGVSHVTTNAIDEEQARQIAEILSPMTSGLEQGAVLTAENLPEMAGAYEGFNSLWAFAMHSDNEQHGALIIINPVGKTQNDELPHDSLNFLAEQVALGFSNACQYKGARELIYTDDLTGLYNHRYLHIALEQEIRRSERYGLEFSVAFIDLDLFKKINDVHGHLIGSNVLRQVAEILRECVRDADMLFRYGGDEFTALLVETDTRGAKIVAERIRTTIEAFEFNLGNGSTGHLTATVGHATYPIHATTKNEIIDLADKAMYLGKDDRNIARSASEVRDK